LKEPSNIEKYTHLYFITFYIYKHSSYTSQYVDKND
jgi:hypothetical protein